mmetsp:Transcript_33700/g.108687  ORF Transcript_33700/g.108687 Transcript_33700/m.108687 type:complete len:217 (-) Transcript_33700:130-780(-)
MPKPAFNQPPVFLNTTLSFLLRLSPLQLPSLLSPSPLTLTQALTLRSLSLCRDDLAACMVGAGNLSPPWLVPFHSDTLILKTSNGAPCCSQRNPPRFLRPWPMILVWGVIWLPRERPNSSTSSDDGAAKSAFGGYRGVEPAVAVTCGSTTLVGFASGRHRSQAACTAALVGAMSVVPPDPRRVAGVVPSASRPCPDVICTGESRRRQRSDVRPVRA